VLSERHTFDRSSVLPGIVLEEVRQDYVLPVAAIGDQPKVRERSLGGAHLGGEGRQVNIPVTHHRHVRSTCDSSSSLLQHGFHTH